MSLYTNRAKYLSLYTDTGQSECCCILTQGKVFVAVPKQGKVNVAVPKQGKVNVAVPKQGKVNVTVPKQGKVNVAVPKQCLSLYEYINMGQSECHCTLTQSKVNVAVH